MLKNLLIACLFTLVATPAFAQAERPGGFWPWSHDHPSRCSELRFKCEHKYELGQEGEGNCHRYREECGGGESYHEGYSCSELRYKCEHKYELGEEGEGNCRRYREACR